MRLHQSALLLFAATSCACRAGVSPGSEVVVVYNSRMPESKEVADYYAQKRQVPSNQVFGFELTTNEEISRVEFRDSLQKPLARVLETNQLWHLRVRTVPATTNEPSHLDCTASESKIRYAVLCYGVPLKIASDPSLHEEGTDKLRPEMRRNEAAVDSELALLPRIEQNLSLAGPLGNLVYAATSRALLSPTNGILLVSRLDGPTASIARGLVDKALEAETNGFWGRAYFDLRNATEPGYKLGDDWIRNASEVCRRLGFETTVDENPDTFRPGFPMSDIAVYIGWYDENVSGPFTQPTVEFMPGAFAYHLHSMSAASIRSTSKHWVGPLLSKGATITMGCVYEPYLPGTPEVAVFTTRFMFYGFSFGEAAYASQPVLSWQTTVVGDPLFRPFGRNPEELHDALEARGSKLVEWYYQRLINMNLANGKGVAECVTFLEQLGLTKQSAVLSEKLGDLYLSQGKPATAVHSYSQALLLGPSPEQTIRLLLTLGDKMGMLQNEEEACKMYQKVLQKFPDYPDKIGIYRKLVPLARKLHQAAEVEKYEAEIKALSRPNS